MASSIVWFRGVPWDKQAMVKARAEHDPGLVEVITELAREVRLTRQDRPEPGARIEVVREGKAEYRAVLSGELVVIGYGRAETVSPSASEPESGSSAHPDSSQAPETRGSKAKTRGPKDYDELADWLTEAGFMVLIPKGRNHPVVLSPTGVRLLTLPSTPSDNRSIKNSVAICRRILGIELRK